MKTLLTIDLDYWTNCYKTFSPKSGNFLKDVLNSSKKAWVIQFHHEILPLIPKGTKRIINIDFHNDILGESSFSTTKELNEGTWGNFLPNSVETYEWYYPQEKGCISLGGGLCTDEHGVVHTDYPINYIQMKDYKNADLTGLDTLVICVSPQWQNESVVDPYLKSIGVDPTIDITVPLSLK